MKQTAHWQALDRMHHLHPFTDTADLNAAGAKVITRGDGIYIYDSEGNKIIDGMAGLWCVNIGYGRSEILEAAAKQMAELPYYNTFFRTTHPRITELSAELARVLPEGFSHFFFAGSGSEAVDSAVRLVRFYHMVRGQEQRRIVISRVNAYHGSSLCGAAIGGMAVTHAQLPFPVSDIAVHIRQPWHYGEAGNMNEEEFGISCARALEDKISELGAERVAAFIAEPIQGAGGVIIPPDSYWPEIMKICRAHDIPLIADEVICGFGRTGEWFGSQRFNIKPDVMTMAKGLTSGYFPMSAVGIQSHIAEVLTQKEAGEFFHGFTYSGHPVGAAVALANLKCLEESGFIKQVRKQTGPAFERHMHSLGDHPLVGSTDAAGMVGGFTLMKDKERKLFFKNRGAAGTHIRDLGLEQNFVMRAVRDRMVLSPPLCISLEELDELFGRIRSVLDKAMESLKQLD